MVKEVAAREVCVDEGVVGRSGGRNKLIKERKSKIIYPASNSIEKKEIRKLCLKKIAQSDIAKISFKQIIPRLLVIPSLIALTDLGALKIIQK